MAFVSSADVLVISRENQNAQDSTRSAALAGSGCQTGGDISELQPSQAGRKSQFAIGHEIGNDGPGLGALDEKLRFNAA